MDTQTTTHKDDVSAGDQELAQVLAGVNEQLEDTNSHISTGLSFEETPPAGGGAISSPFGPTSADEPAVVPEPVAAIPVPEPPVTPPVPPIEEPAHTSVHASAIHSNDGLEGIKKDALSELRPLVDKLNVSAEEKFDTYLLLLRSTDDETLISPAHEAAKLITDEARRAQALLDIIKEIDYLSSDKAA